MRHAKYHTKTVIELNGKRYDANTGRLIDSVTPQPAVKATKTIDGVIAPPRPKAADVQPPAAGRPAGLRRTAGQSVPSHLRHTKTKKATTLMRHAVKKPAQVVIAVPAAPPKPALADRSQRLVRAVRVEKSHLISRFGSDGSSNTVFIKKEGVVPVVQPVRQLAHEAPKPLPAAPRPAAAPKKDDIFDKAVKRAVSHKQKPVKHKKKRVHHKVARKIGVKPRTINYGAAVAVVFILTAFIAYQNVPNFAMRVASARSGVAAQMPGYRPAGFGLSGPIQYKPGQITINFAANGDRDRAFRITQRTSNWNSQTLLANHVSNQGEAYQTYQENGRTIYIYDNSNATWVDGGIWYQIEGNADLTSDQLLRIAASL